MESALLENAAAPQETVLSRKEKRKLLKKAKRKQKRTEAAEVVKKQQEPLVEDPTYQQRLLAEQAAEEQRQRVEEEQHRHDEQRWLERERVLVAAAAQKVAAASRAEVLSTKRREAAPEKVAEGEAHVCASASQPAEPEGDQGAEDRGEEVDDVPEIIWEGNQITVRKRKVTKKRDDPAVAEEDRPTHNPLYPVHLPDTATLLAQAEADADKRELCQFYMRTGACRHFDRCSRKHPYPSPSHVLLIRGMFTGLGPPGVARTEDDAGLEHTEDEIHQELEEFYEDVLPEFEAHGLVTNFKVCVNSGPHLRGNVYVSYKDKEAAVQAHAATNGRFYGGKQLVCTYAPFTHWRSAICGVQRTTGRCQHGGNCNYLHCFRNPDGAFAQADFEPVDGRHEERPTPRRHESRFIDAERSSRAEASGKDCSRHDRVERSARGSDRHRSRGENEDALRPSDDHRTQDEWLRRHRRRSREREERRTYEKSCSPEKRHFEKARRKEWSNERRSDERSSRGDTEQRRKRRRRSEESREDSKKDHRPKRQKETREISEETESRGPSGRTWKESGREEERLHSREGRKVHEERYGRWTPRVDEDRGEGKPPEGHSRQTPDRDLRRISESRSREGRTEREGDSGRPRDRQKKRGKRRREDSKESPERQHCEEEQRDMIGESPQPSAPSVLNGTGLDIVARRSVEEGVGSAAEASADVQDPPMPSKAGTRSVDPQTDIHGSRPTSTTGSANLDEHLMKLRRAVEQSFKERTLRLAEPG